MNRVGVVPALPIHGNHSEVNPLSPQSAPRPKKVNSGEASSDTSPLECEIKNSLTWD